MNLNKLPAGLNPPKDVYVIIEISANSYPVKYEINEENNILFVDRFIPTSMFYPCNYGYVNKTLSLDGDPIDALVYTIYPIHPGSVIRCRPIGLLDMQDESGKDCKIIFVPCSNLTKDFDNIKEISDLPESFQMKIISFFKYYKEFDQGKWTKIYGFKSAKEAQSEIVNSIERFKRK